MSMTDKQLLRIAGEIRQQLRQLRQYRHVQADSRLAAVETDLASIIKARRKLAICRSRGWEAAAGRVLRQVAGTIRDMPYRLSEVERAVGVCEMQPPALGDIYKDLKQADEEFDELIWQADENTLAVRTDPIELNHVFLGEFEIRLHVPNLGAMRYHNVYTIAALDPHPAASNEHVTHPHVSDERLCEGDAGAAIQAALANGRVCDFFQIVQAVLTTYNPGSPFVSLDNWDGTPCYDCGYVAASDDIHWCSCCEHDFCGECTSYCRRCDETTCLGCLAECRVCGEQVCTACMSVCPECGERLCLTCRDELQCPCLEEREDEDDTDEDQARQAEQTREQQAEVRDFDILRQAARATATRVGVDPA